MKGPSEQKKRFVIQKHQTPTGVHWDWMLEEGGVLQTWRVNCPPQEVGENPIEAEKIADHSPRFLTYEGPVQQNTGRVQMEDRGRAVFLRGFPEQIVFRLEGQVLRGCFEFCREEGGWFLRRVSEE